MPPRRRRLVQNPSNVPMPDFTSNGYAPSRARKRRQNNCDNDEAITMLQQEWLARQQVQLQLWNEQNPQPSAQQQNAQQIHGTQNAEIQENQVQLENLVGNLQQLCSPSPELHLSPPATPAPARPLQQINALNATQNSPILNPNLTSSMPATSQHVCHNYTPL
ncbi:hypothetical protein PNOK_0680700 [Pyrrhoderma noxium]|uniref:Uncharacterized protein n=1 Tax=Pyrrhoderma noxium TaxID=2282107 RepID=A0A286UFF1_9AGAM|nr:hypothetical protein PNOK_0680700 [Pyrrhoderma noxium]